MTHCQGLPLNLHIQIFQMHTFVSVIRGLNSCRNHLTRSSLPPLAHACRRSRPSWAQAHTHSSTSHSVCNIILVWTNMKMSQSSMHMRKHYDCATVTVLPYCPTKCITELTIYTSGYGIHERVLSLSYLTFHSFIKIVDIYITKRTKCLYSHVSLMYILYSVYMLTISLTRPTRVANCATTSLLVIPP